MINKEAVSMVRVMVPHDSGFASGGIGPFRFPYNVLIVLLTPWTWWGRFDDRILEPRREEKRLEHGEAPRGYFYKDFPSEMTLSELVTTLGFNPEQLKNDAYFGRLIRVWGRQTIKDVPSEVVTEAIRDAQVESW